MLSDRRLLDFYVVCSGFVCALDFFSTVKNVFLYGIFAVLF